MVYWYLGIVDYWKIYFYYIYNGYYVYLFFNLFALYLQKNFLIWLKIILMKLLTSTEF